MVRIRRNVWSWFVLVAIASLLAGCATWEGPNEPTDADKSAWAQNFRRPTAKGQLFGATSRSQQVERNLGIR